MVRFLRRRIYSQGRALTFVGVGETFVALNRGPRVRAYGYLVKAAAAALR